MATLLEQHRQTEFQYYPQHYVIGIIDALADAEAALQGLLDGGFPAEGLSAWYGMKGAAALDGEGTKHGLLEHVWRKMQDSTADAAMLKLYTDAAQDGRIIVGCKANNDDEKWRAGAVISEHHGHSLIHCGTAAVESLDF